jgi:hypothetical protein
MGFNSAFKGLRYCATNQKVVGSTPDVVIGIFYWHKSFWSHYGPGVESASNRNEYQFYYLGGKCGRCVGLKTLTPSCAVVKKSGNLNSPLQAYNGTALPLPTVVSKFFLTICTNFADSVATINSTTSYFNLLNRPVLCQRLYSLHLHQQQC